jgi:hypothetical protein
MSYSVCYPQTVPLKPQEICHTDTRPLPFTADPHNGTIASLRHELLGKIDGQANDILKLKSLNAQLILSNAQLKSSDTKLMSLNTELILSNAKLISSNTELTSKVTELTLSNAELLKNVHQLVASYGEMSSTLQCVSCGFWLDAEVCSICSFR